MPLFECTNCGAIDNTALSDYWAQEMDNQDANKGKPEPVAFKPKCSKCYTGSWHGAFLKRKAKEYGYVPDPNLPGFIMPAGGWKK